MDDRSLEQRGRRVGVVFQQPGRSFAVVAEIEPAVEILRAGIPTALDRRPCNLRDAEFFVSFVTDGDNSTDEIKGHLFEFAGGLLDAVDFGRIEGVAGGFVPIRLTVDGVEDETEIAFDAFAPVRPRRYGKALQAVIRPTRCDTRSRSCQIRRG